MIKTCIFDMDGVLLDSEVIYLTSLKKYLKTLGIDANIKELSIVVGMKMEDITHQLMNQYQIQGISEQDMINGQDYFFDEEVKNQKLECMEGLLDVLNFLKNQNITIALASSSERSWIDEVLQKLDIENYFEIIVSGDDVLHSKPNPEIFKLTAKMAKSNVQECIVIEDSKNGICAGKKAGMFTIAYKGSIIEQDTSLADVEVSSYAEFLNKAQNNRVNISIDNHS